MRTNYQNRLNRQLDQWYCPYSRIFHNGPGTTSHKLFFVRRLDK